MSTLFRAAASVAAATIDVVFGEDFVLRPMAFASGRYAADQNRAVVTLTAVLTETAGYTDPSGQRNLSGMSKDIVSQHAAGTATIEIAKAAAPYQIAAKDRFVCVATGVVYEVSGAPRSDLDHIVFRVVALGTP